MNVINSEQTAEEDGSVEGVGYPAVGEGVPVHAQYEGTGSERERNHIEAVPNGLPPSPEFGVECL